jgi:S-DNA-T family DNA segregation ATPase FtsK/SpoIIIE
VNGAAGDDLPHFDVSDRSGVRRRVRPGAPTDTLADLALHAWGWVPDRVWVEDRPVPPGTRLDMTPGLRHGAAIGRNEAEGSAPTEDVEGVIAATCAVTAGPDCRGWFPLAPGRHILGRGRHAHIRIDDPELELYHAAVDVDAAGGIDVIQIAGRCPIDDRPVGEESDDRRSITVLLGASQVEIRSAGGRVDRAPHICGSAVPRRGDPWRFEVRRAPVPSSPIVDERLEAPGPSPRPEPSSPITVVGSAVGLVGAGVVAMALRQPMFVMFAAVGAIASLATFAVSRCAAHRRHRRAVRVHAESLEAFVMAVETLAHRRGIDHRRRHPHLVATLDVIPRRPGPTRTWERRIDDGVLRGVVGSGTVCRPVVVDADGSTGPVAGTHHSAAPAPEPGDAELLARVRTAEVLEGVAAPMSIHQGRAIAVQGPSSAAVARSLVVQLATWYGPADWRLAVVASDPSAWSWARWLPHIAGPGGSVRLVDGRDPGAVDEMVDSIDRDGPATLVVVDRSDVFASANSHLRRRLAAGSIAVLAALDAGGPVPAVCRRVLVVGSRGRASWDGDLDADDHADDHADGVRIAGLSVERAEVAARALAPLVDPEAVHAVTGLPGIVGLADLLDLELATTRGVEQVLAGWSVEGWRPVRVPLGRTAEGIVEFDLDRDGPHGLIAGTTGAGKSELLRSMVASMALRYRPDELTFVLVDYKGGSTFDACTELPHVVGLVTDLDDGLAERALVSLDAEVARRERLLRAAGAADHRAYVQASRSGHEAVPRLVVVIDEFATLAAELPDFLAALVGIAQRGRSLGVHLLLATQRPSGVVSDDIRANTNLRIALRLNDPADAHDVVADPRPASLPRSTPGRAVLRLGPGELVEFQAACCSRASHPRRVGLTVEVVDDGANVDSTRGSLDDERRLDPEAGLARCAPLSELVAAVATVGTAMDRIGLETPRLPWLPPLAPHGDDELARRWPDAARLGVVGIVDDPAAQTQHPLCWAADGNLVLIGSLGSGTTSALLAIARAWGRRHAVGEALLYVIDGRGDERLGLLRELAQCGGVLPSSDVELVHRLLRRLADEIDRRLDGRGGPPIALLVDGLTSLRSSLSAVDRLDTAAMLERVIRDGPPVGIVAALVVDEASATATTIPASDRWLFHTLDPSAARTLGLVGEPIPTGRPGRVRVSSSGLVAQLAHLDADAILAGLVVRPHPRSCATVERLPALVDPTDLPPSRAVRNGSAATELAVGLDADRCEPAYLHVPDGDHVVIAGAARTGRTWALGRVVDAWRDAHPTGEVMTLDRGTIERLSVGGKLVGKVGGEVGGRPLLLAIDDADRLDDPSGVLGRLVADHRPGLMIAATVHLDVARSLYGHFTRALARSRCGIVLTAPGEIDGELLGTTLPRRTLIAPRPGLGWLVDTAAPRLVQLAGRLPACPESSRWPAANSVRSSGPTAAPTSSNG